MKKRKYSKTIRAEQQEQTRERIVEATVALHEELGPAKTSIKAIAEKAGVQRVTVYRYFPDDVSLFQACTSHWLSQNQPPDLNDWAGFESADEKTYAALLAFYQYYSQTETMWTGAYRDAGDIVALQIPMGNFEAYIDQVRDTLLKSWKRTGKRKQQLSVTLRHGLRFTTWQSLKRENLKDKQITELVMSWIQTTSN
ncbi:MAG: TetR/AcrR family transcriptional regulator [Gammaproteobacteria bacterium]